MVRHLPPLISASALGSLPAFVEAEIGPVGFDRVMYRSGLPYSVLENRGLYIPQTMLTSFFHQTAREFGDETLGLLVAPRLTIAEYGSWGAYVLGAPTLRDSLKRSISTIGLHTSDAFALSDIGNGCMKLEYRFCTRDVDGYQNLAPAAIGVMWSIFKHYLGPDWQPVAVDVDISNPAACTAYEDLFGCPVRFGKSALATIFNKQDLSASRLNCGQPPTTAADVARRRRGGVPASVSGAVARLITLQLLDGRPDLEDVSAMMKMGPRRLQRSLATEGTTFRELANNAVARRSRELLVDTFMGITEIAVQLGYSSPSHFSRAFRKQAGQSPSEFRELRTGTAV